jgi:hypothetical protein
MFTMKDSVDQDMAFIRCSDRSAGRAYKMFRHPTFFFNYHKHKMKMARLTDEMVDWLDESLTDSWNCRGEGDGDFPTYSFKNGGDAMRFKLTWHQ